MKRLVALLLVLGILACTAPLRADKDKDDKKEEKKKDDKKKDDKKDDKKDEKKDKPKTEEKLTDAQKEELKKLSGTFTVEVFEEDGKKKAADDLKKMKVVQKGAEWTFHLGEEITQGKDTPHPDKNPKEIDSYYINGPQREKTVKGIYQIDGDTIKYCWADVGKDRPKEFATKADSGLTLLVLKRVKDEAPAKEKEKKEEKKEKEKKEEKKDKDKDKDKDKKEEKKDDK
jgi:uncharacterized protein (TIGR03067 family)